jgi:exodeoxyribonuclease V alpha subunit
LESIKITIIPEKEIFYNADSNFGIYACNTSDEYKHLVTFNKYGNFSVSGVMPRLTEDSDYQAEIQEKVHEKYGHGYELLSIKQDRPQTIQEQHSYIRSLLKEEHAELIIGKYPNHDLLHMFQNDEIDYSDLKGIGEKTYKKLKQFLLNHLDIQDALVTLAPLGVTFKMLYKMIEHYGDVNILLQKIESNVYLLTEVKGIGFKKVDQYALAKGIEKEDVNRIHAGLVYVLEQEETQGHSYIKMDATIEKAFEILKIDRLYISSYLLKLASEGDGTFYFNEDGSIIALYRNYNYENRIKDHLIKLLNTKGNFNVKDIDNRVKKVEEEQGFTFTDEQLKAIHMAVEHNVVVVSGRAGTGKSTLLKGILSVLHNYTYETCALSGKAAMRIVESGLTSKTIHRLLGVNGGDRGFSHGEHNKLPYDIVVLDESGMVGSHMFYSLISAIEKGKKFIIVGDEGQLSPIGAGNIFKDIIHSGVIPVCELSQVHRQALKSGVLLCANQIRDGIQINGRYDCSKQVYGELNDFHLLPMAESDYISENIIEICKGYKHDVMDLQVITAMKDRGSLGSKKLNKELQEVFNPGEKQSMQRGSVVFKTGDKIIHNGNNYDVNVFNGHIGKVIGVEQEKDKKKLVLDFNDIEQPVKYEQSDLDKIDLAYAITCHRGQGSGWKHVIVALDFSAYMLLSRQWVYTALTRSIKSCVMICENRALHQAISNNDSSKRNTFLKGMLKEVN